jgi:CBS domain-containing protein
MQARDIMTTDIVVARPEASVYEIAQLMTEKRISGVPVVNTDGDVLGIVSESDLLHRAELGTEAKHKWWLKVFADPDQMARAYAKSHGLRAVDVMSRPVVSVDIDRDLADVAQVLDSSKIKRVPVLQDGALVGIITRADLVRALCKEPRHIPVGKFDDGDLQKRINAEIKKQSWLSASMLNVLVDKGTVELWGFIDSQDQKTALRILIEGIEGVTAIEDHVRVGRYIMSAA